MEAAKKLAETAQAQAKAERSGRLVTIGMLVATIILVMVLSYNPIRREVLRQQAMGAETVNIPAGDYALGDVHQWNEDNPNDYLIPKNYSITSFSIDTSPVTNRRYRYCIQAGICSRPNSLRSVYEHEANANNPVVNITAVDAAEFCNWIGQLLPNDKEWELAAMKNKIKLPASKPNIVGFFYEWTRSPHTQSDPEWINTLGDPPEWLTQKGGSLDIPLAQIMTYRQGTMSIYSDETSGFRCVLKH